MGDTEPGPYESAKQIIENQMVRAFSSSRRPDTIWMS